MNILPIGNMEDATGLSRFFGHKNLYTFYADAMSTMSNQDFVINFTVPCLLILEQDSVLPFDDWYFLVLSCYVPLTKHCRHLVPPITFLMLWARVWSASLHSKVVAQPPPLRSPPPTIECG